MPKTKAQKSEIIKEGESELKNSKFLVFGDFTSTANEDLKVLRRALRTINAGFHVVKKRLMGVILKNAGIEFNPKQFKAQMGTIFAKGDISEVAQVVYKFSKEKPNFKLLGALDITAKSEMNRETLVAIGKLPSRQVLLGQVLGGLTGPLRKLVYTLSEIGKKKPSEVGGQAA